MLHRHAVILSAFLIVATCGLYAQTTPISGIINSYARVSAIDYCTNHLTVDDPSMFQAGDNGVLIQMKGARIDTSNTEQFGSIIDAGNAGNYEIVTIATIAGNVITLRETILRDYDPDHIVQLVTLPHYEEATVAGTMMPKPWDGTTGGVIALEVAGSLTLEADIDASGRGFRGGNVSWDLELGRSYDTLNVPCSAGISGAKGEGIADPTDRGGCGRARLASGGGGGNMTNAGGGGGANYGSGGKGGGEGGWYRNVPVGGLGGDGIAGEFLSDRALLGGGGGGGHQNESSGTDGEDGGGIVIIVAGSITGNQHAIIANGLDADTAGIDGAGGGGAGGTIILDVARFDGPMRLEARGGNGGNNHSNYREWDFHPTGGGGGGGVIAALGAPLSRAIAINVAGGREGRVINEKSSQFNWTFHSAPGLDGAITTGDSIMHSMVPFAPLAVHTGPDRLLCAGSLGELIGSTATGGNGAYHYRWAPSYGLSSDTIAMPLARPDTTTVYTCRVTDHHGCSAVDTINVTVMRTDLQIIGLTPQRTLTIDSTLPQSERCRDVVLKNVGASPIVIDQAILADNRTFSIPPSLMPLTIPPFGERTLMVCFAPNFHGEYSDTIAMNLDCWYRIPISATAPLMTLTGNPDCGPGIQVRQLADSEYALKVGIPYPNPAAETIELSVTRHAPAGDERFTETCMLYNAFGEFIRPARYRQHHAEQRGAAIEEEGSFVITLNELPEGLYFIRVAGADGGVVHPVIISR